MRIADAVGDVTTPDESLRRPCQSSLTHSTTFAMSTPSPHSWRPPARRPSTRQRPQPLRRTARAMTAPSATRPRPPRARIREPEGGAPLSTNPREANRLANHADRPMRKRPEAGSARRTRSAGGRSRCRGRKASPVKVPAPKGPRVRSPNGSVAARAAPADAAKAPRVPRQQRAAAGPRHGTRRSRRHCARQASSRSASPSCSPAPASARGATSNASSPTGGWRSTGSC